MGDLINAQRHLKYETNTWVFVGRCFLKQSNGGPLVINKLRPHDIPTITPGIQGNALVWDRSDPEVSCSFILWKPGTTTIPKAPRLNTNTSIYVMKKHDVTKCNVFYLSIFPDDCTMVTFTSILYYKLLNRYIEIIERNQNTYCIMSVRRK